MLTGYFLFEFGYKGAYPIPLDFLLVVVYSATWVFSSEEQSKYFRLCSSLFFGVSFMYLVGFSISPNHEQLLVFKDLESYNEQFNSILDDKSKGELPVNYIDSSRLLVEFKMMDFKTTPPQDIVLDLGVNN